VFLPPRLSYHVRCSLASLMVSHSSDALVTLTILSHDAPPPRLPSLRFSYHKAHHAVTMTMLALTGEPTCLCDGGEHASLCYHGGAHCKEFTKGCATPWDGTPTGSGGDLVSQRNPTCNSRQYAQHSFFTPFFTPCSQPFSTPLPRATCASARPPFELREALATAALRRS
jgi:hypothetical protein